MIAKHAVVAGLAALVIVSVLTGCGESVPTVTPQPTPKPDLITSESQAWELVMRVYFVKDQICYDPASVELYRIEEDVKRRYAGRIDFGDVWLSRDGLLEAIQTHCDLPEPTAVTVRRIVATAKPSPTRYVHPKGRVGGGKGYVPAPTSTPYPTSTPIPATAVPTATPNPTLTPTPTPYPTPTSKIHEKPEYIATAERILNDVDLQMEVYGRELDDDEIWSILVGLNEWYTVDFLVRCMNEMRTEAGRFAGTFASNADDVEWEYPPATEKVLRRFPDADFLKDFSGVYFLVRTTGPGYTPFGFHQKMLLDRSIQSMYFDPVQNTHVKTVSMVDFETCEPVDIKRIKLGVRPHYLLGTSYIRSIENHVPLEPDEVGHPVEITAR